MFALSASTQKDAVRLLRRLDARKLIKDPAVFAPMRCAFNMRKCSRRDHPVLSLRSVRSGDVGF